LFLLAKGKLGLRKEAVQGWLGIGIASKEILALYSKCLHSPFRSDSAIMIIYCFSDSEVKSFREMMNTLTAL